MSTLRTGTMLVLSLGLYACTSALPDATRNLPIDETTGRALAAPDVSASNTPAGYSMMSPHYNVTAVNVSVPEALKVSEANVFVPVADIVWREDPRGDRHVQVKAIYDEAMARGTVGMTEGRAVVVNIEITRFHALTEKARYTIGGNHALWFNLTVLDAATGAIIDGPRLVVADTHASGGSIAMAEEARGITQKVVIEARLAEVIKRELTRPIAIPVPANGPVAVPADMVAVTRGTFDPVDLAR